MKFREILISGLLLLSSCDSTKYLTADNLQYEITVPPGMLTINEDLYADQTEVTNIMYQEFLDWTIEIFGKDSEEYRRLQLDHSVWENTELGSKYGLKYFNDFKYSHYPVVGISLEQAQLFTNWRSERVAQLILMRKKLIKSDFNYSKENYFTIDRYKNGSHEWIIAREDVLVPEYTIPTRSEWEFIAGYNSLYPNGIDSLGRHNRKVLAKNDRLLNSGKIRPEQIDKRCGEVTCEVNTYLVNIYGMYWIQGNVSEMTADKGISKGSSWYKKNLFIPFQEDVPFNAPNAWTGFRNIARQRLIKIKHDS